MSSRPLAFIGILIIIVAIAAAAGYAIEGNREASQPQLSDPLATTTMATSTDTSADMPIDQATTTTALEIRFSSSTVAVPLPNESPAVDTSSWHINVDQAAGFSIDHPANMVENRNSGSLTLSFPKSAYFRWPLQDEASVTISSAPSCQALDDGRDDSEPVRFSVGGREFVRSSRSDVGAGQRSFEVVYDTIAGDRCLRVSLLIRGANGSGFYVDNSSLIRRYDQEHVQDLGAVVGIFNAMVRSLRILAPEL